MIIKYAVYDPVTGENTIVDAKEDAIQLYWSRMIEVSKPFFHNTMWMTVEQYEDGSEIWKNENGTGIEKPKTFEEMNSIIESHFLNEIKSPTPVEILP